MAFDTMSDSALFQLEKYFNSNPYREYAMNKPYIPKSTPLSAHSHRLNRQNKSTFHQLIDNENNRLTLDRITYKLRMKSDLNVNNLQETHSRHHRNFHSQTKSHSNSNHKDKFRVVMQPPPPPS